MLTEREEKQLQEHITDYRAKDPFLCSILAKLYRKVDGIEKQQQYLTEKLLTTTNQMRVFTEVHDLADTVGD